MTKFDSPTVLRRELGAALRKLRAEPSLTVEEVAGELVCSPSKISRIETALACTAEMCVQRGRRQANTAIVHRV